MDDLRIQKQTGDKMRICYFGGYCKNSERNISLIQGLNKNGVEIVECWVSPNQPHFKLFSLLVRFLRCKKCDAILVGFVVDLNTVILARLLAFFLCVPLLVDIFYSQYQTCVHDRKWVKAGSKAAKRLWRNDKLICKLSDLVILDTNTHIEYFVREFKLKREKFVKVLVGARDDVFYPRSTLIAGNKCIVHFHGTFIPLQGIEYIVQAAKLLEGYENIEFYILGSGQTYGDIRKLAAEMNCKNIVFYGLVNLERLAKEISKADICLGIFGKTEKAQNVIPFKVYQVLAMAKPAITARTPAAKELLTDKQNCLLCEAGNPRSLADAILELKENSQLREKISENGHQLFKDKCTPKKIVRDLLFRLQAISK